MNQPVNNKIRITLLAGEPSGDFLGANLMRAIRTVMPRPVEFSGVGGPMMVREGLNSLFDYSDLSLIGAAELLPHLRMIYRRIDTMVEHIDQTKPDLFVTIDVPGFARRVVKRVREARLPGHHPRLVHIVAPSVWAYKPKRAEHFAALYDMLLALLPFEPPYFEAVGLPCRFIGHPVAWDWREKGDGAMFREEHNIPPQARLLGVFLGSRAGEIVRHWPIFRETVQQLALSQPDLACILPLPAARRAQVEFLMAQEPWPTPFTIIDPTLEKKNAFAALDAALAKSGTVTLELGLAGVPMVVAYKVAAFTGWLVKRLFKIPYVSLPNILAGRFVVPELIQQNCTVEKLVPALAALLDDSGLGAKQREELAPVLATLLPQDGHNPSVLAAKQLLDVLN